MCSLINPAVMEKLTPFPTQTNTVMLWLKLFHVNKKGLYAIKIESWIIVLFLILQFKKKCDMKDLVFVHYVTFHSYFISACTKYSIYDRILQKIRTCPSCSRDWYHSLTRLISPPFRFHQQTIAQNSSEHKGKYMHAVYIALPIYELTPIVAELCRRWCCMDRKIWMQVHYIW